MPGKRPKRSEQVDSGTGRPPKPFPIRAAVQRLRRAVSQWKVPIVTEISRDSRDPFRVLISTVLSLRTKDETTADATYRLFDIADNPTDMLTIPEKRLARTIYPVGFYNVKARQILEICQRLINDFDSVVPRDIDTLGAFPGVGRKTANLVVTLGHGLPGICVDIHVHRISNRWGYVNTKTPDKTEMVLREILPRAYWIEYNDLLVTFGQNCCAPVSPHCSRCPLADICPRRGVMKSR